MLTIKEAEQFANQLRNKASRGEKAIKALSWLKEYNDPASLSVATITASACPGYKEAMEYLNANLRRIGYELMNQAIHDAQRDMDELGRKPDDA